MFYKIQGPKKMKSEQLLERDGWKVAISVTYDHKIANNGTNKPFSLKKKADMIST